MRPKMGPASNRCLTVWGLWESRALVDNDNVELSHETLLLDAKSNIALKSRWSRPRYCRFQEISFETNTRRPNHNEAKNALSAVHFPASVACLVSLTFSKALSSLVASNRSQISANWLQFHAKYCPNCVESIFMFPCYCWAGRCQLPLIATVVHIALVYTKGWYYLPYNRSLLFWNVFLVIFTLWRFMLGIFRFKMYWVGTVCFFRVLWLISLLIHLVIWLETHNCVVGKWINIK